jgi:TonB-linked SusC/RagA family outer membrane protein
MQFTKTVLVMKLTSFLLLAMLQVSAGTDAQTVTYTGQSVPLTTVFSVIKQQTGYFFFYRKEDLAGARPVTLQLENVPLQNALEQALSGQPLNFEIQGNTIFITLKPPALQSVDSLPPKTVRIRGAVFNEAGQPLAGANVTIKETEKGTVTNARGEFDLGAIPVNSTIIISFIGYAPQKIMVKDPVILKIYLKVTNNELDKVVIQGYGTTTQRVQTGDISTVTSEEIERQPVMNPLLALEGKVPGLDIVQQSGYASAPVKVELNGRQSIGNFPSDPLYIVDGVPLTVSESGGQSSYVLQSTGFLQNGYLLGPAQGQSPLYSLNSDDIESITVLKDADATAIYGSRGATGVILITTKKGKAGKTRFELKVDQGYENNVHFWKMLNTPQYLSVRREAFYNDGIAPNIGNAPDLLSWDTTKTTDWQHALQGGTGKITHAQGAFSGGDAHTTFRVGMGYKRQESITNVSGADQQGSFSLNLEHKSINQRFSISSTTEYTLSEMNAVNLPGQVDLPPNAPVPFDSAGNLNWNGWGADRSNFPFAGLKQRYTMTDNFLNSNFVLGFEVLKGLTVKTSFGYNYNVNNQNQLEPISSMDPETAPTGNAFWGYNINKNWIVEPQATYDAFIGKGKISAVAGGTLQDNNTDGQFIEGTGYTNDDLLRTISNAPNKFASDVYSEYKYTSIFGRVNYNWENKYILNLSARRDGSSRFGPDHEFGNFGAVGAAWIFTEEHWLKNLLPVLSFGKLRGSYGSTGSDYVTPYSYLTRWTSNGLVPYGGIQPLIPTQHANPDYAWQVDKKAEIALDLGFLKDNRINLSVVAYRNRCGNQLLNYPLPTLTGFSFVVANLPALVQNQGLNFIANVKIINTKNLVWSVNGNLSMNENKLVSYPNLASSVFAGVYEIGQPLNLVYLLHATGVDPQTGQYTFQDRNHDGVISTNPGAGDDRVPHELSPHFFGGFGTDFTYKQFQVNLWFTYKNQIGPNAIRQGNNPGMMNNQPIQVLGHEWQKPGDRVSTARFTENPAQSDYYFAAMSDGGYTDASFVRLKNASVSYGLPKSYISKIGMTACSLYVRGENLFVITKYQGIDPETQSFGGLPIPRIVTLGLNCSF